ncbi:MAG: glycosyltransferase family 4 protein [Candidatus Verstraetearchaeota archaeon]|nr:glycosyltransferase family 4 protein [Candidatus Verstraetearchaeota archaeon]
MRVAATVPWSLQWEHTGLSKRLMGQISAIASSGVEIELFSHGEEADYGAFSNRRVRATVFEGEDPNLPLLNSLSFSLAFSEVAKGLECDLLHCFNTTALFLDEEEYLLQMLNPTSAFVKEMLQGEYPEEGMYANKMRSYEVMSSMERREGARAELVIVSSELAKRNLVRLYGIPESKIRVIPTGVSPSEVDQSYEKKEEGLKVVLYPNRVSVMKGFRYMAEAMLEIRKSFPSAVMIVLGRIDKFDYGVVSPHLKVLRDAGCVSIGGFVDRARLREYYKMADVVVVPSLCDDLSLSLLEAVAMSTPVVATENTGFPEVDEVGVKVRPKDGGEIADAVISLLSDRRIYREKREGAKAVIGRYLWPSIGKRYLEAYREVQPSSSR